MEISKSVGTQVEGDMYYVDRGDPASTDFLHTVLTIDGAYHELDLSAIVPAIAANHLVHISLRVRGAENSTGNLRKAGNVNTNNMDIATMQRDNGWYNWSAWVMMNADRKIEYAFAAAITGVVMTVRGWWEG